VASYKGEQGQKLQSLATGIKPYIDHLDGFLAQLKTKKQACLGLKEGMQENLIGPNLSKSGM
jgi:hypothetical protein